MLTLECSLFTRCLRGGALARALFFGLRCTEMAKRLRDSGDKEQGGRQKRRPPSSLARLDTADFDEAVGLGKREVEAKALEMCKTPGR